MLSPFVCLFGGLTQQVQESILTIAVTKPKFYAVHIGRLDWSLLGYQKGLDVALRVLSRGPSGPVDQAT